MCWPREARRLTVLVPRSVFGDADVAVSSIGLEVVGH